MGTTFKQQYQRYMELSVLKAGNSLLMSNTKDPGQLSRGEGFETNLKIIAQSSLTFVAILPHFPNCWNYKHCAPGIILDNSAQCG